MVMVSTVAGVTRVCDQLATAGENGHLGNVVTLLLAVVVSATLAGHRTVAPAGGEVGQRRVVAVATDATAVTLTSSPKREHQFEP